MLSPFSPLLSEGTWGSYLYCDPPPPKKCRRRYRFKSFNRVHFGNLCPPKDNQPFIFCFKHFRLVHIVFIQILRVKSYREGGEIEIICRKFNQNAIKFYSNQSTFAQKCLCQSLQWLLHSGTAVGKHCLSND